MELICDKCGSIGFGFGRKDGEVEAKHHVEGYTNPRGRVINHPHPGHFVKVVPETSSLVTLAFSLPAKREVR